MAELQSRIRSIGPETPALYAPHGATLVELRAIVDEVKQTLATAIQERARNVERGVDKGADYLRGEIRRAPGMALGIAVIAGALVALAISQPRRPQSLFERYGEPYRRAYNDIDLAGVRARVEKTAASVGERASGLIPSIDQLAQSLARMEPASIRPILDTGKTLVRDLWEMMSNRVTGAK
jgi:hypothetical protein